MPGKVIGIDLGTTNSVVAVMEGGQPAVIVNQEGARTTPSVVAIAKDGERLVGQVAKRQAVTNPENTVFSIKRFMGRRFDEVVERVLARALQGRARRQRRRVGRGARHASTRRRRSPRWSCRSSRQAAEDYLGEKVTDAVITVPAYFNDAQRQATQGRRQDRRPQRAAHHQRADRGGARLRPRQEGQRDDRRLRLRRRHVRHLDPRSGRRHRRGEVDQRRHAPRRRRSRPARHRVAHRGVQEEPKASTSARTGWRSSA